jgi:hypothetical protein
LKTDQEFVFYLVKIEPRFCRHGAAHPFAARASLAVEEGVLAHWTLSGARAMTTSGVSIAVSFSMGVRPCSAIEKRSWL